MVRSAIRSPLAALITAASLVAACGAASPSTLGLPAHRDLDGYPAALLVATLVRDGQCLYADDEGRFGRWLPIWPAGFILRGDSVMNHQTQVAKVGDRVNLGGGEYHESDYDFLRTLMSADLPAGCRDSTYWLVSNVTRGQGDP